MLHLRILVPTDLRRPVLEALDADAGTVNISIVRGSAFIETAADATDEERLGDVIEADIEAASLAELLHRFEALGVPVRGAIDVTELAVSRSDAGDRAAIRIAAAGEEVLSWEQVAARTSDDVVLSRASVILMAAAGAIAAVGIITNNVILLVGAMIVSPDFGPMAGLCVALVGRQPARARSSGLSLAIGFSIAAMVAFVGTGLARVLGAIPVAYLLGTRPVGDLISTPNLASVIVAVTAGIAGMVALGQTKSGAVVGVLVSVTTIPAAANIGVALAMGQVAEALGSLGQLLVNLGGMIVAGTATLVIGRRLSARRSRTASTLHGSRPPGILASVLDVRLPEEPVEPPAPIDPAPAPAGIVATIGSFVDRLRGS